MNRLSGLRPSFSAFNRQTTQARNRFLRLVGVELILAVSLVLLGYVGYGEAFRTYPRFEMEKLGAQGDIVQSSMSTFLIAGLPIEQFPGFSPLTDPLLKSDATITAIYVADPKGQIVFANSQVPNFSLGEKFSPSNLQEKQDPYQITESPSYYRISLDLRNKFESVGSLHVLLPRAVINQKINNGFVVVLIAAILLMILFGVFSLWLDRQIGSHILRNLRLGYSAVFFVMAIVVVVVLINLYATGIQAKTKALANSLSTRLNSPLNLGLTIEAFDGLDKVFNDYRTSNPDLSYIALTANEKTLITTDARRVGSDWQPYPNHYEYRADLSSGDTSAVRLGVHVGIPQSIIFEKLWRSVKNFFVLFIASAFLSLLLFDLVQTLTGKPKTSPNMIQAERDYNLSLIQPYYFFSVFAEGMSTAFLSPYFQGLAKAAGADKSLVSTIFTVYFLAFVVALIPAGRYAERHGVKPLLILGSLLTAIGLLSVAMVNDFYWMFLIRALAGAGQGVLLVGVQSYILQISTSKQRTQGAAIIVFGYNGGMISGTTIGALLVVYMGVQNVFVVSGTLTVLILLYTLRYMPHIRPGETLAELLNQKEMQTQSQSAPPAPGFFQSVGNALKDFEFVKAMLLIGIPTKGILTGVTIFALPLILSRLQYAQEDVGQIVMLYSGGVLIASAYASRMVDRLGRTSGVLFLGALGSGIGLILISLVGWNTFATGNLAYLGVGVLMTGMALLGLAHGLINAPIITHVANTQTANELGQSSTASLYRLLERIGHISGPTIVGYLLLVNQDSSFALSWIGGAMIVFSMLFLIRLGGNTPPKVAS